MRVTFHAAHFVSETPHCVDVALFVETMTGFLRKAKGLTDVTISTFALIGKFITQRLLSHRSQSSLKSP